MELNSARWKIPQVPFPKEEPIESRAEDGPSRDGTVESVNRALALLELLANSGVSLPLGRIAKQLGLPPSTAHRLLRTLHSQGYINQTSANDRYKATLKLFHLGSIVRSRYRHSEAVLPWMRRIANQVDESVTLLVQEGSEGFVIERVESSQSVQVFAKFPRVPLYCTAGGKSLLSMLPAEDLDKYLEAAVFAPYTPKTITNAAVLRSQIGRIRQDGYAIDEEELQLGIRCVAVPLVWADHSLAALAVTGPNTRMTDGRVLGIASLLRTAKEQLGLSAAK